MCKKNLSKSLLILSTSNCEYLLINMPKCLPGSLHIQAAKWNLYLKSRCRNCYFTNADNYGCSCIISSKYGNVGGVMLTRHALLTDENCILFFTHTVGQFKLQLIRELARAYFYNRSNKVVRFLLKKTNTNQKH